MQLCLISRKVSTIFCSFVNKYKLQRYIYTCSNIFLKVFTGKIMYWRIYRLMKIAFLPYSSYLYHNLTHWGKDKLRLSWNDTVRPLFHNRENMFIWHRMKMHTLQKKLYIFLHMQWKHKYIFCTHFHIIFCKHMNIYKRATHTERRERLIFLLGDIV